MLDRALEFVVLHDDEDDNNDKDHGKSERNCEKNHNLPLIVPEIPEWVVWDCMGRHGDFQGVWGR